MITEADAGTYAAQILQCHTIPDNPWAVTAAVQAEVPDDWNLLHRGKLYYDSKPGVVVFLPEPDTTWASLGLSAVLQLVGGELAASAYEAVCRGAGKLPAGQVRKLTAALQHPLSFVARFDQLDDLDCGFDSPSENHLRLCFAPLTVYLRIPYENRDACTQEARALLDYARHEHFLHGDAQITDAERPLLRPAGMLYSLSRHAPAINGRYGMLRSCLQARQLGFADELSKTLIRRESGCERITSRAQALQVPEAILRELDHQWREHAGQPLLERPWASCESTINGAAGWFATHLGTRLRELGLK